MFRNYLTVAVRNLLRHRLYTAINVLGLGIGIGSCIFAVAFVRYELSWDQYHEGHDRIFRMLWETPSMNQVVTNMPGPLGPTLMEEYPEIVNYVRMRSPGVWVKKLDGSQILERLCVADPSILDVFSFHFSRGSKESVFQKPYSVVVTESAAKRWFGAAEPVGRTISVESRDLAGDYLITGVVRDSPPNTSSVLQFDLLTATHIGSESAKIKAIREEKTDEWNKWDASAHGRQLQTFVKLRSTRSADRVSSQFHDFLSRHLGADTAPKHTIRLQSLDDIHLYGRTYGLSQSEGEIESLYQVGMVALLVVLVGCINFVNLSTARAGTRQREIGVRKVTGARRGQLIAQFSLETLLLGTIATVIGATFAEWVFPSFLAHGGHTVPKDFQPVREALPFLPFLVVLISLVAGSYPSIVLSSFSPVKALKSTSNVEAGNSTFRKGLVLVQFTVCILLIAGTHVMNDQVSFMRNRHLGFERDLVVSMPIFSRDRELKPDWGDHLSYDYEKLKANLIKHPNIIKASAYRWPPGTFPGVTRIVEVEDQKIHIRMIEADEDFLDLFEIPLVSGRNFRSSALHWRAKREFILNQAAVTALGWEDSGLEEPIGKPLNIRDGYHSDGSVVGVVRDFQVGSLRAPIEPVAIHYVADMFSYLGVKIKPDHIPQTIAFLKEIWERTLPQRSFEYAFLDDRIHRLYQREEQTTRLIGGFSVLAILLGCMGLFGLASFTVERRRKEIAIRKTLGATIGGIVVKLTREPGLLVMASNVIAWPIGFYLMSLWLERFAYRIDLHLGFFAIAGAVALLVALVTVAYQAIRAARANPVDALRYE
jgi:putative ABC transport system permease protein